MQRVEDDRHMTMRLDYSDCNLLDQVAVNAGESKSLDRVDLQVGTKEVVVTSEGWQEAGSRSRE